MDQADEAEDAQGVTEEPKVQGGEGGGVAGDGGVVTGVVGGHQEDVGLVPVVVGAAVAVHQADEAEDAQGVTEGPKVQGGEAGGVAGDGGVVPGVVGGHQEDVGLVPVVVGAAEAVHQADEAKDAQRVTEGVEVLEAGPDGVPGVVVGADGLVEALLVPELQGVEEVAPTLVA